MTGVTGTWRRTHHCGEIRAPDQGMTVTLMGWAHRRRDHGGLVFSDLRDRTGLVQCVLDPGKSAAAHAFRQTVRSEFVLAIVGEVASRPAGTENPKLRRARSRSTCRR